MSTIASPRASTSVPSSSRTSLDIPQPARPQAQRRNRAALRDYYGLKAAADGEAPNAIRTQALNKSIGPVSELDREGFDAGAYVKDVLSKEALEGVLKIEGELISGKLHHTLLPEVFLRLSPCSDWLCAEIKNLDGERKALVYDNYSKLIAATDTIKKVLLQYMYFHATS